MWNNIRIGSWNVNGLRNKLNDPDFIDMLKEFDICFLQETWMNTDIQIDSFCSFNLYATRIHSKGRCSGGMVALVKQNIRKKVKFVGKKEYGIWLKVNKDIINDEKHLYIGGVYIPPSNSKYAPTKPFESLERDVSDLQATGSILVLGDLNARTGGLHDFLLNYEGDSKMGLNFQPIEMEPDKRFNTDLFTNMYGKKLTQLCIKSNLLICNGRVEGDLPGRHTCFKPNGASVVDYGVVSAESINQVTYFQVQPPNIWSDHCCIKLCLKLSWDKNNNLRNTKLSPLNDNFIWSKDSEDNFRSIMESQLLSKEIDEVLLKNYKLKDNEIDKFCSDVTSIYQKAAQLGLKKKIRKKHDKNNNRKFNHGQQMVYLNLKRDIKNVGNLLLKYPRDPFIRGRFFYLKRNLTRLMKKALLNQREKLLNDIEMLESKDPGMFWKLVNTIKEKKKSLNTIDPQIFHEYFKKLHQGIDNRYLDDKFKTDIQNKVKQLTGKRWVEVLDKEITIVEIKKVIKSMKNKKSCGFDNVSNEMIKCSIETMSVILLKLFNHILYSEKFPTPWAEGYIHPLFKKGEVLNPSNYRGITISSCLGKLFTKILSQRLCVFLEVNKVISINQIGFTPNKRTSDHILVLKTLVDLTKQSRSPLYICFIDLKSAFDTVWREGLLFKLINLNFSRKFINILSSMYGKAKACIKTSDGYTELFNIPIGTRQGCNLSPTLFNCFINDLPKSLDSINGDQLKLFDKKLSCILYADDIVLLSKTTHGLQKLISGTEDFCNKWQLTINVAKTKIMVFNSRKKYNMQWIIYDQEVEVVTSFCYLGIELDNKGTFKKAITRLYNKSWKAYLSLMENFNFHNGSAVSVMLKLFNTMVQPILTYECELWGVYGWRKNECNSIWNYIMSNKHQYDKLHSRVCKQFLGIDKQTPDVIAKAELGRFPIMGTIIKRIYSYWQHVLTSDSNSLIYKILQLNIEMDRKGHHSYYTRIKSLLAVLQCKEHIYPKKGKSEISRVASFICKQFCNTYEEEFFNNIKLRNQSSQSIGKFEMYSHVKRYYRMDNYLINIKNNILRRNITQVRCASNILPINILRKYGVKREQRFCQMCKTKELGTELHTIMYCINPKLAVHRQYFLNSVHKINPQFLKLDKTQQFYYFIQCIDNNVTILFAMFLNKIFNTVKSFQ